MKRLKNKLLSMESDTTTYKAMYEGSMSVIDPASTLPPYVDYSATYYNENIGFDITAAHKLAQDQPYSLCHTRHRSAGAARRERGSGLLPPRLPEIHGGAECRTV